MKKQHSFIFLDNNILCELTKNYYYNKLVSFIKRKNLYVLISDVLLLESFNPNPIINDRTDRIGNLFSEVDYIISCYALIWEEEMKAYPSKNNNLPYNTISDIIPKDVSKAEKKSIFQKLYNNRLLKLGINLSVAANTLSNLKREYPNGIKNIIDDAINKNLLKKTKNRFNNDIKLKKEFLWGMDLRLCDNITKLFQYKTYTEIPSSLVIYYDKLQLLYKHMDSYKLEGVHLTSLAFWYEYIKQNKPILGSDLGDFLNLSFIPYCAYAVLDNSRTDMLKQIFQNENNIDYETINVYNLNKFKELIN